MAEVIDLSILSDPLYREIIQGLDEISKESAKMGMTDVAIEIKKTQKEIKQIAWEASVS